MRSKSLWSLCPETIELERFLFHHGFFLSLTLVFCFCFPVTHYRPCDPHRSQMHGVCCSLISRQQKCELDQLLFLNDINDYINKNQVNDLVGFSSGRCVVTVDIPSRLNSWPEIGSNKSTDVQQVDPRSSDEGQAAQVFVVLCHWFLKTSGIYRVFASLCDPWRASAGVRLHRAWGNKGAAKVDLLGPERTCIPRKHWRGRCR